MRRVFSKSIQMVVLGFGLSAVAAAHAGDFTGVSGCSGYNCLNALAGDSSDVKRPNVWLADSSDTKRPNVNA